MNVKEIARAVIKQAEKFYSEDQPRDDHGRWGGGDDEKAGRAAEKASTPKQHTAAADYHSNEAASLRVHNLDSTDKAAAAHERAAREHEHAARAPHSERDSGFAREASTKAHRVTEEQSKIARAHLDRGDAARAAEDARMGKGTRYTKVKSGADDSKAEKFYSPDQERDASGKWGGGGNPEEASTRGEHKAAAKYHEARAAEIRDAGQPGLGPAQDSRTAALLH